MDSGPQGGRARTSGGAGRSVALVLWAVALAPGPARGAPLTLADAETRALAASPAARTARLEGLAARERAKQAYARHLGDVDLVGFASRFEGARLVRPLLGPVTPAVIATLPFDRDQLHYGAAWQIPLFAGGALVLGDQAARLAERAAAAQTAHTLEEIRYNVRAAYRGVLGVRHALEAAVAYEQALTQDEESARLKVRTEAWSAADGAKVSFSLASARARHAALAAQLGSAEALLAALMGDEAAVRFELAELPAEPAEPGARSPDELQLVARTRRHDLGAAQAAAEAQGRRAAVVRAGYWPQLAFAGSYLWNDGRSLGRPLETWELTLQLKIPLLSDIGRSFAAREADAAAAQATERERAKALEVRGQVIDALGRVDAARAALAAGTAQRTLGAEVARVEKLKLEAGSGKVEDYLAARAQELEGETGYWQGLYAVQSAYDYLALVTGTGGTP